MNLSGISSMGFGLGRTPGRAIVMGGGMNGINDLLVAALNGHRKGLDLGVQDALAALSATFAPRQQMAPPKPVNPIGGGDLLPMAGIAVLAKLLGASDRDIAEGAAGFMQGRGQWAQGQNQYNQQVFGQQDQQAQEEQRMAMERAKLGYGAAVDERERMDKFDKDRRSRMDNRWEQEQLNQRAEMRDPAKVKAYDALKMTPEGRAILVSNAYRGDREAIDAVSRMTEQEKLTASKAATEDAMRPLKVEEQGLDNDKKRALLPWVSKQAEANYNKTLADVAKRGADTALVNKKVLNYDEEFRLRRLNVESQILNRAMGGGAGGGKGDYFGKGQEGQFNAMKSLAEAQMEKILQRGAAASGGMPTILPEDQESFAQAKTDLDLANYAIQRMKGEKAALGKQAVTGGTSTRGNSPRADIDVSGGFTDGNTAPVDVSASVPSASKATGAAALGASAGMVSRVDVALERKQAREAIRRGGNRAKIAAAFKKATGQNL